MVSKFNHKNFVKGWLVGDFKPALFKSKDIEVGVKYYEAGFKEKGHIHKISTEYTMIIKGKARINNTILEEGDGIEIKPFEVANFECILDCVTLVIKTPSSTSDKYLI